MFAIVVFMVIMIGGMSYFTVPQANDARQKVKRLAVSEVKLRNTTIGVVNEEVNLVDDLGIAGSFGFPTWTTSVNITNNNHYITSTFSTGLLSIFTVNQPPINISNAADQQAPWAANSRRVRNHGTVLNRA